jgi:hypothetical protein
MRSYGLIFGPPISPIPSEALKKFATRLSLVQWDAAAHCRMPVAGAARGLTRRLFHRRLLL